MISKTFVLRGEFGVFKKGGFLHAVPPWVLLKLGQLGKGAAMLLGRGMRKRYRNLPPEDRDKVSNSIESFD